MEDLQLPGGGASLATAAAGGEGFGTDVLLFSRGDTSKYKIPRSQPRNPQGQRRLEHRGQRWRRQLKTAMTRHTPNQEKNVPVGAAAVSAGAGGDGLGAGGDTFFSTGGDIWEIQDVKTTAKNTTNWKGTTEKRKTEDSWLQTSQRGGAYRDLLGGKLLWLQEMVEKARALVGVQMASSPLEETLGYKMQA